MRAATLLAFVFAAVATPLLAAPVVSVDGSLVARDSLFSGNEARDFLTVEARDDESVAFFLPYMGRGRGPISVSALPWNSIPPATSNVPTVVNKIPIPPAPAKRDSNPTAYSARELHELFLRAAEDGESGASFLTTLGGFLKNFIRRDDTLQRRDVDAMVELLARAAEDDESGAGLFSGLVKGALHFLPDLFGGGGNSQPQQQQRRRRRDVDVIVELLRRAAEDDESGAGLFGTLGHIIGGLFSGGDNNRRDLDAVVELFARAAMNDELL